MMSTAAAPAPGPLYARVADRLTELIEQGTLRPGDRIPSVRKLHRQWGVSMSTVLEAYRVLEDRGLLEVRAQSGHYVRAAPVRLPEPRCETGPRRPEPVDVHDLMVRVTMRAGQQGLCQLGCGLPDRAQLPLRALDRVIARVMRESPDRHDYAVSPGHARLRRVLAGRMIQAGCALGPDDIVVTAGAQEALDICLRSVTCPGDAVVVQSPTYFGLLQILRAQGLRAIEVPGHPTTGVDVDAVEAVLQRERVGAVALSVNYTNPLGALVPPAAKQRLVDLCTAHRVPLVEDDAYGDLGFDGRRPPVLKAFDREGYVLTVGTLSKTLSPGLRIGWVAPGRYLSQVARTKLVSTLGNATVPQLAAAEFLQSGGYDRHLRRLRRSYGEQVRQMSDAIRAAFPSGTRISRPRGGQFLWVELPPGGDALALFEAAWDRGISIAPGPMFSPSGGYRRFLRLNCSVPWSDGVQDALRVLAELIDAQ